MQPGQPKHAEGESAAPPLSKPPTPLVLAWCRGHPRLAILLVSLLAVVINNYPILFCGKSYVSPMSSRTLVYNWWPPLPGMDQWPAPTADTFHSVHGSDTEAMMWWGVPMGFIESRSLLEHGELPLWNRYGHGGEPLLGQAISMLGDPLQLIVILGRGSAWAWDIKFLTAKWLFCCGFGFLILRLLGSRGLSLIYAALGAYCGAFFYINSHLVFFVFCYAPWVLLSAIEWTDLRSPRRIRWGLVWLAANCACFLAGHVEVAVVLMGGLNLTALIYALTGVADVRDAIRVLGRLVMGAILFLGLTTPVWLPFLVSLQGAFTVHDGINVVQLPITHLPGVFDDVFYLLFRQNDFDSAIAPGGSLLILAGCCFTLTRWRQLRGERFCWINAAAIIGSAGFVFGWVPSSFIAAIPMLNRVGHVYTDFSYLLVLHLTIQSAYGFKCLAKTEQLQELPVDVAFAAGVFAGLVLLYCHGYIHEPIPWAYVACAGAGAIGAPALYVCLNRRQRQIGLVGWAGILLLGFLPIFRFGLYHRGNDRLLMVPDARVVLNTSSPAIAGVQSDQSEPFRVTGWPWAFNGNYSAVYELEDISSCSPLSSADFVNLVRQFPGMELIHGWMLHVVDPDKAQPLLNLLNVKYLFTYPDVQLGGKADFRLVERSDFGVLENPEVWPRAFFTSQIRPLATDADFISEVLTNGRQPFIALTPEVINDHPALRSLVAADRATIFPATHYHLSVNETAFDVHAASAGMVCLTETQAKDFSATANDVPMDILIVNRAFKGIYLDQPGDYHIIFTYRPRHWRLACAVFWLALAGTAGLAWLGAFREKSLMRPK